MRLTSLIFIAVLIAGCKKDKPDPPISSYQLDNGVLVLCEGLFQQNNSSVSWISHSDGTIVNDFFQQTTNRNLGDTGNDMKQYGGKIYIVVNNSSTIEVLSANNFSSIKQIEMVDAGTPKQPRSIVFNGSNAYVSCYDGYVDVIDTVSLTVTQRIAVGANPEGMAITNNKLYVANSGGLNFPNVDTTLSVIDLVSHTELSKITVGPNPGTVAVDNEGDVYVISRGDYGAIPARLVRVNSVTDSFVETFTFNVSMITPMNAGFLISDGSSVNLFDPILEQVTVTNLIDLVGTTTLYNLVYDDVSDRIYALDAMNYTNTGYLRAYSSNGSFIANYHVGLNPSKVIFYD